MVGNPSPVVKLGDLGNREFEFVATLVLHVASKTDCLLVVATGPMPKA